MAKTLEGIEGRLERVTAQLEQAAKRNRGGGFMSGLKPFVLGALVGAGAALLYAPQAGEQTRAILQRNANDLQTRATQAANSVKERLPEQAQDAQDKAQSLLARTKEQAKTAVEQGKDTPQSAKADAKDGLSAAAATAKKQPANGSRAEEAQAQLRRDRKTGSENPA